MDQVDKIIAQWQAARPDLETSLMGPFGRLSRAAKQISSIQEKAFGKSGLNTAGFDVLSALRRSGAPCALSVGDLMSSMMITSGTMTNRIDQLEKIGLVRRTPDPDDARRTIMSLTPEGLALIDQIIGDHVNNQHQLLSGLTADEIRHLDTLLRKLTTSLGV